MFRRCNSSIAQRAASLLAAACSVPTATTLPASSPSSSSLRYCSSKAPTMGVDDKEQYVDAVTNPDDLIAGRELLEEIGEDVEPRDSEVMDALGDMPPVPQGRGNDEPRTGWRKRRFDDKPLSADVQEAVETIVNLSKEGNIFETMSAVKTQEEMGKIVGALATILAERKISAARLEGELPAGVITEFLVSILDICRMQRANGESLRHLRPVEGLECTELTRARLPPRTETASKLLPGHNYLAFPTPHLDGYTEDFWSGITKYFEKPESYSESKFVVTVEHMITLLRVKYHGKLARIGTSLAEMLFQHLEQESILIRMTKADCLTDSAPLSEAAFKNEEHRRLAKAGLVMREVEQLVYALHAISNHVEPKYFARGEVVAVVGKRAPVLKNFETLEKLSQVAVVLAPINNTTDFISGLETCVANGFVAIEKYLKISKKEDFKFVALNHQKKGLNVTDNATSKKGILPFPPHWQETRKLVATVYRFVSAMLVALPLHYRSRGELSRRGETILLEELNHRVKCWALMYPAPTTKIGVLNQACRDSFHLDASAMGNVVSWSKNYPHFSEKFTLDPKVLTWFLVPYLESCPAQSLWSQRHILMQAAKLTTPAETQAVVGDHYSHPSTSRGALKNEAAPPSDAEMLLLAPHELFHYDAPDEEEFLKDAISVMRNENVQNTVANEAHRQLVEACVKRAIKLDEHPTSFVLFVDILTLLSRRPKTLTMNVSGLGMFMNLLFGKLLGNTAALLPVQMVKVSQALAILYFNWSHEGCPARVKTKQLIEEICEKFVRMMDTSSLDMKTARAVLTAAHKTNVLSSSLLKKVAKAKAQHPDDLEKAIAACAVQFPNAVKLHFRYLATVSNTLREMNNGAQSESNRAVISRAGTRASPIVNGKRFYMTHSAMKLWKAVEGAQQLTYMTKSNNLTKAYRRTIEKCIERSPVYAVLLAGAMFQQSADAAHQSGAKSGQFVHDIIQMNVTRLVEGKIRKLGKFPEHRRSVLLGSAEVATRERLNDTVALLATTPFTQLKSSPLLLEELLLQAEAMQADDDIERLTVMLLESGGSLKSTTASV